MEQFLDLLELCGIDVNVSTLLEILVKKLIDGTEPKSLQVSTLLEILVLIKSKKRLSAKIEVSTLLEILTRLSYQRVWPMRTSWCFNPS